MEWLWWREKVRVNNSDVRTDRRPLTRGVVCEELLLCSGLIFVCVCFFLSFPAVGRSGRESSLRMNYSFYWLMGSLGTI